MPVITSASTQPSLAWQAERNIPSTEAAGSRTPPAWRRSFEHAREADTLEDRCGLKPGECRLAWMVKASGPVVVKIVEM